MMAASMSSTAAAVGCGISLTGPHNVLRRVGLTEQMAQAVDGNRDRFDDDAVRQREVVSLLRLQRVEGMLLVVASGEDSLAKTSETG
jgi:hypothetical protein